MASIPQKQFVDAFNRVKYDYIAKQKYGLRGTTVHWGVQGIADQVQQEYAERVSGALVEFVKVTE